MLQVQIGVSIKWRSAVWRLPSGHPLMCFHTHFTNNTAQQQQKQQGATPGHYWLHLGSAGHRCAFRIIAHMTRCCCCHSLMMDDSGWMHRGLPPRAARTPFRPQINPHTHTRMYTLAYRPTLIMPWWNTLVKIKIMAVPGLVCTNPAGYFIFDTHGS